MDKLKALQLDKDTTIARAFTDFYGVPFGVTGRGAVGVVSEVDFTVSFTRTYVDVYQVSLKDNSSGKANLHLDVPTTVEPIELASFLADFLSMWGVTYA